MTIGECDPDFERKWKEGDSKILKAMEETIADLKNAGVWNDEATELEWLKYFFLNADFGPAHEDVISSIQEQFEIETGKLVPEDYRY